MTYVQGFVTAVPTANKEKYRKQASDSATVFKQFGVKPDSDNTNCAPGTAIRRSVASVISPR